MSNVFIPYTPYNVLLSLAVAACRPHEDNFMILAGKDHNFMDGAMTLLEIFRSVGMRHFSFERSWDESNIKNFFLKKHNLKVLERELAALPSIERLYYIREWNVYTTYAVHTAQKLNGNVSFSFMEDGIYTYVEEKKELKNFAERFADRLVYGPWHVAIGTPGTLRPEASICAMFPDILPDIYRRRDYERIDLAPLLAMADEKILARHTGTAGTTDIGTLIALGSITGEEYRKVVKSFVEEGARENSAVAIKRHPNDDGHIPFIPPGMNVVELEPSVPIELFYFRYHKTLRRIVGGLSTALMTARRMLPDAEIESIVSKEYIKRDSNAEKILELFSKIGIKVNMIE